MLLHFLQVEGESGACGAPSSDAGQGIASGGPEVCLCHGSQQWREAHELGGLEDHLETNPAGLEQSTQR